MCLIPTLLMSSFLLARTYVVTSPAVIYHPHTAMLWVHLSGLHEPVQVTVQLQRKDRTHNITLLERKVQEPHLYLNITFPVSVTACTALKVEGDTKKVMLRALEPGIFIQTDKAVYKPGQQGEVGRMDHPALAGLGKGGGNRDPSGNRIAQWQEVSPQQGIVDLSLPLAAEPALGTYIIEAEGKSHSFSVEEYVLPKFEMTIDLPAVVLEKDKKFQMEICGRYTYGKPVQGKVQASLCQPFRHIWNTEKNGCFSTEVLLSAFNLTSSRYQKQFQVQASLVEDGTGRDGDVLLLGQGHCCSCVALCSFLLPHGLLDSFTALTSSSIAQGQVNETAHTQNDGSTLIYQNVHTYLRPFSASRSFLRIRRLERELPCGQPQQLWVDYIFSKEALGTELESLDVVFLGGCVGSFSLELPIGLELAPMAKVLGYVVLPNSEMVADSTELKVAKCFPNEVKMAFSEDRALPGSALQLLLEAAPGSLCAVRAVDRSVLLLKPEAELSTEAVSGGRAQGFFCSPGDQPGMGVGRDYIGGLKRILATFTLPAGDVQLRCRDLWTLISALPFPGGFRSYTTYVPEQLDALKVMSPVRTVPMGEGGSAEVAVTVPDAITKWEAGMFCTSPLGLGLAPATAITAFKPFFVELALPYSVVRNEAFSLVATVFNYLRQCLRVSGLEVSPSADELYGGCICADEARTFRWGVRATSLGEVNITISTEALSSKELCGNEMPVVPAQGRVDTMIKPLLVAPWGRASSNWASSLSLPSIPTDTEEISLEVPANILEGSQRAHITVMGDIMGNALQNLDHLLAMPYGCGEQNMVRFAPNIYIQQYLEKSGQLHPDIRAKAQGFLQSGYQRELLYKHDDGSYSAFGKSDDSGNTWLTAFVLKSFGQARAYVAIEERHITDALRWLQKQQQQTGCFRSVGKLFNNALQGGVSDTLSLSAYVTAAILELGLLPKVRMTPSSLEGLASATDDLYTQALLAYVFGLAGRREQQQAQLQSLAQRKGQLYWQRKEKALPPSQPSWAAAAPAEVEMTAYVLLAYLSQPQLSSADLGTASQIVRWLSKQQNPYGGFASTQDTVVALQALAKYAALTYGSNGDFTVTVTSPTGTAQDFVLHNSNRLVLQRAALHELPGTYRVGWGCPLCLEGLGAAKEGGQNPNPTPGLCPCRYTGERPATNMVVIEAKLPSGYIPDKSSMVEVRSPRCPWDPLCPTGLTKEEETFAFTATQDFPVRNLQPATVTLYDYYETGDRTDAAYSAPCGSGRVRA
uniref:Alpha-2-macroglobulin-like protein 1 n=1 Tax=Strix occidentalis caurina TaxID=311401 RepID=A0A8D0FQX4_STROC